jgi:hypothetical protein
MRSMGRPIFSQPSTRAAVAGLLALGCIALTLLVAHELGQFERQTLPEISAAPASAAPVIAASAAATDVFPAPVPWQNLAEMIDRPLFSRERRPPPPAAPVAATAAETVAAEGGTADVALPDVVLVGVLLTDSRRIALLRQRGDGRTLRVSVGDAVGSWQVTKIEARRAVLQWQDKVAELLLNPSGLAEQPTSSPNSVPVSAQ